MVDSAARITAWQALQDAGHWRGVVALRAHASPDRDPTPAATLVAGAERVDLAAALAELRRSEGVERVRVDSGGHLAAAMVEAGLIDELSLLIHPVISGRGAWLDSLGSPPPSLGLVHCERFEDGIVWTRYRVAGN